MKPLISGRLTPEHPAKVQERAQNNNMVTMHRNEQCRRHITHNEKFILTQ